MMSHLRLLALVLLTATVLLGQKYEVHLSPRYGTGDAVVYSSKGSRFQQVSIAGQVTKQEEISAEFEAKAEVLEVDAAGEPVRVAFTVSQFTKSENGVTTEMLKPGSVVLVDGGAADPISLQGGNISEEAREVFGIVYSTHKPGSATDDDIFGTKEPRAFGESWPMNAKLASEDLRPMGIEVSPENLKGSVALLGRNRVGEADCLNVRGEMTASGFSMKAVPAGATVDEANVKAVFDGCVPMAGTSYQKGMEMTMKARLTVNASKIETVFRQRSSETWKEVRK